MASPGDKKGQRRGVCGHIMASFDLHKRCARCRDKGIGDDDCVAKKSCVICDGFTDTQKDMLATPTYKIRKDKKAGVLVSPDQVTVIALLKVQNLFFNHRLLPLSPLRMRSQSLQVLLLLPLINSKRCQINGLNNSPVLRPYSPEATFFLPQNLLFSMCLPMLRFQTLLLFPLLPGSPVRWSSRQKVRVTNNRLVRVWKGMLKIKRSHVNPARTIRTFKKETGVSLS